MAEIGELADGGEDPTPSGRSAKLNSEAGTPAALPRRPPSPEQSIDELAASLKKSAFFMTSLDDAGDEENVDLQAIQALLHEGTRAEVAKGLREQGNERAKAKSWKDAKEFYGQALAALKVERQEEDVEGKSEADLAEEDEREKRLQELCLANRALCHLELRMYSLHAIVTSQDRAQSS
jgi:hypothetical protein